MSRSPDHPESHESRREPSGLRERLERLPPGHPSSPYEADGTRKPPVPLPRASDRASEGADTQEARRIDDSEGPADTEFRQPETVGSSRKPEPFTDTGWADGSYDISQGIRHTTDRGAETHAPQPGLRPDVGTGTADENQAWHATVERVAAECGLEGDERLDALRDAYRVAHEYLGPLIVKTARDMLPDLRADVEENPAARVVFVGRDGLSLAAAVSALDPDFYEEHCSEVVLSRILVETAVQDLELRSGLTFPQVKGFRGVADKVDQADTVGAYQQLTGYLRCNGIAAGQPGSYATLVDTSYKGTVQELLSAIYPETVLKGRYLFFAASPDDPHPATKFGYAMHLEGLTANGGLPVSELPVDPELTFSHQDALGAVEETLHGAGGSPKRMLAGLPEQSQGDFRLEGFNPLVVSSRYSDAEVRGGVMRVCLGAVVDLAVQAADPDGMASSVLDHGAETLRDQLQAWISGAPADPRLSELLDSFVRRTDKRPAARLADAIRSDGTDPGLAVELWEAFGKCGTLAEKEAFADRFVQQVKGGGEVG